MNSRIKMFFVIISTLLLSFGMMGNTPAAMGEPLVMAMEATGAHMTEVGIHAWLQLPNDQLDEEKLREGLELVMEELGVASGDYQLTQQQENKAYRMQAEAISSTSHILATIQIISGVSGQREGYLIVRVEEKEGTNYAISLIQEDIRKIAQKFGSSPHISTCLIGWLNGKLRDGEQHNLLKKAFKAVDGKIIDQLEAEQFVSYTGFASGIVEWLQVGGGKINLNMAMRYSQYDNRTYVTIGSPIITREY